MKKGALTCLIIVLILIALIVIAVLTMFLLKICPPNGPWPMPPWCKADSSSSIDSLLPDLPEISELPLLKPTPEEEIEIDQAIVLPTQIQSISYPDFYNEPSFTTVKVKDPYCAIVKEEVAYPADYLGEFEFPPIVNAPLPASITRSIGIKDVWIMEPNLNDCPFVVPYEKMRESLDGTLLRVKALGADEITFSNYISFENFEQPVLQSYDKAAISESDMRYFASQAEKMGLGMTLYLNLAPGSVTVRYEILSDEWLASIINQWEPFVLNQAQIAEETGIDAIMINHFDYQPGVHGFESVYQTEMSELLAKVREVYSGRVLFLIEPVWGTDVTKMDDLLNSVDGFIYTPITNILASSDDKSVTVSNLKKLYYDNLSSIGQDFSKYDKKMLLRVLIQSERDFLENGWNEDMFCIQRGDDPCYQKNLTVDFSLQAIAMEAMMEAVSEAQQSGALNIENIDIYGYWYTDVILPDFSQPQMAHSIRNKPAESVVYEWFKR